MIFALARPYRAYLSPERKKCRDQDNEKRSNVCKNCKVSRQYVLSPSTIVCVNYGAHP